MTTLVLGFPPSVNGFILSIDTQSSPRHTWPDKEQVLVLKIDVIKNCCEEAKFHILEMIFGTFNEKDKMKKLSATYMPSEAHGAAIPFMGRPPLAFPDDPYDYFELVKKGLPRTGKPRKVLIVGAGIAGLVAAFELLRAGHEPTVLEASQRVGGRIYTYREPFSEGLYGEAGAMRIPKIHEVTLWYIKDLLGLKTRSFPNVNVEERGFYYLDGKLTPAWRVVDDPDFAANRILRLWKKSFAPIVEKMQEGVEQGRPYEVWASLMERYKDISFREFLTKECSVPWSREDLRLFGIIGLGLGGYESMLQISFAEWMRIFYAGWDLDQQEVIGGLDQFPHRLINLRPKGSEQTVADRIRFGTVVTRIRHSETSVTVTYKSVAGEKQCTGDYVILTVPFPLIDTLVTVEPPFSPAKYRAIRNTHYIASAKVFLQTRERFWEEEDLRGQVRAGTVITDLPIRASYFPHDVFGAAKRGMIIASYTWEDDAVKWYSMDSQERVIAAAGMLGKIFPQVAEQCEVGASVAWHQEPFARGAFPLYYPGQINFTKEVMKPEGRIYLAGDHASYGHGWIEGAVRSGLRASLSITEASLSKENVRRSLKR